MTSRIVLNERQAGVAVEGVEAHNRSDDRIRISLVAVDTHGFTALGVRPVCAAAQPERAQLFMPRG